MVWGHIFSSLLAKSYFQNVKTWQNFTKTTVKLELLELSEGRRLGREIILQQNIASINSANILNRYLSMSNDKMMNLQKTLIFHMSRKCGRPLKLPRNGQYYFLSSALRKEYMELPYFRRLQMSFIPRLISHDFTSLLGTLLLLRVLLTYYCNICYYNVLLFLFYNYWSYEH